MKCTCKYKFHSRGGGFTNAVARAARSRASHRLPYFRLNLRITAWFHQNSKGCKHHALMSAMSGPSKFQCAGCLNSGRRAHLAVVSVVVIVAAGALSLTLALFVGVTHLHGRNALRLTDALQHQQHSVLQDGTAAQQEHARYWVGHEHIDLAKQLQDEQHCVLLFGAQPHMSGQASRQVGMSLVQEVIGGEATTNRRRPRRKHGRPHCQLGRNTAWVRTDTIRCEQMTYRLGLEQFHLLPRQGFDLLKELNVIPTFTRLCIIAPTK